MNQAAVATEVAAAAEAATLQARVLLLKMMATATTTGMLKVTAVRGA